MKAIYILLCFSLLLFGLTPGAALAERLPLQTESLALQSDETPPQPEAPSGGSAGFLAIPAAAFYSTFGASAYENHGRYLMHDIAGLEHFRAPVYLPQGAVITKFSVCFLDELAAIDVGATLYTGPRTNLTYGGDITEMSHIASDGSAGYAIYSDTSIAAPVIDNTTNAYWVGTSLAASSIVEGNRIWFCGAYIQYTPPQTKQGMLTIPGAAFHPWKSGYYTIDQSDSSGSLAHDYNGEAYTNGGYMAQVDLPHGAVMKKITMYYSDNASVFAPIKVWMQRANRTGNYYNMASLEETTKTETSKSTTDFQYAKIDNETYSYWVFVDMPSKNEHYRVMHSIVLEYDFPPTFNGLAAVSDAAFVPLSYTYIYENHGRWLFQMNGTTGTYVAPVYLPQGAVVKEMRASFYSGSSATDSYAVLVRTRLGGSEELASVQGKLSQPGYFNLTDTSITNATIDNSLYGYFAYWNIPKSASAEPSAGNVAPTKINIIYTVTQYLYLPQLRK